MAILKIARMGDPALMRRADAIKDPNAPEIRRLIADMRATLADAEGLGLAAPQVHVPLRLVLFYLPGERPSSPETLHSATLQVLINPVVTPLTSETALGVEGCLSLPGLCGVVPRHTLVRYQGIDDSGRVVDRVVEGFDARVVQHECDHLQGVLYPMRMVDLGQLGFVDEVRRAAAAEAAAEATI